jgi:fructoselysine-6-P-deglycase FrlB-like protein
LGIFIVKAIKMALELTFDYQDWKDTKEMVNTLKTFSDEKFLRTLALTGKMDSQELKNSSTPIIKYEWGKEQLKVLIYWV